MVQIKIYSKNNYIKIIDSKSRFFSILKFNCKTLELRSLGLVESQPVVSRLSAPFCCGSCAPALIADSCTV